MITLFIDTSGISVTPIMQIPILIQEENPIEEYSEDTPYLLAHSS